MQLPSHVMFAIHSTIGLSSKGHHMSMGRIVSGGASGTVEGSGQQHLWRRLLLTHGELDLVFPYVFLFFH